MGKFLYDYQREAVELLKSGSILNGGVGSGKSRTSLAYYMEKECGANITDENDPSYFKMKTPRDLYIITTAKKRDNLEWRKECLPFLLDPYENIFGVKVVIDSWNNISKYCNVIGAFFIFDEQRLVGSGKWVRSFLRIAKCNRWILLSATPGDTWTDYIPVFLANGFYKNRTEFNTMHIVFNPYVKYPKVMKYMNVRRLINLRDQITVEMNYHREAIHHHLGIFCGYDTNDYEYVFRNRKNLDGEPVRDASEYSRVLRRIVNSSDQRAEEFRAKLHECPRLIVFYNFDYELDILRRVCKEEGVNLAEWNGHKHMDIPTTPTWVYLVQYMAGAEGWNCTETDTILFYSLNHSYKIMCQAAGRIDRVNSKHKDLKYYYLVSKSSIDASIKACLEGKKSFNELEFYRDPNAYIFDFD